MKRIDPRLLAALLVFTPFSAAAHSRLTDESPASGYRAVLPPIGGYPTEATYSLALHMHGSMSEQSGSIEWHTAKAESLGVDVIWWTEHDWRLTNFRHMNKFDFESAIWDPLNKRWAEPDDAFPGQFRFWEVDSSGSIAFVSSVVDTAFTQGAKSLRLDMAAPLGDPEFTRGALTQTTSEVHNKYSLAKRVRIQFAVRPDLFDPTRAKFFIEAELSDHPEGTHTLRYVAGSLEGESETVIPIAVVPGAWTPLTLDLSGDARARFTSSPAESLRAEDDNLNFVRIGLEAKDGTRAVVHFDDYRIVPDSTKTGDVLLNRAREIGAYYESLTPSVRQYFGTEISKFKAQPHLNGYAPDLALIDYGSHVWQDTLWYAVDQIHAQGGAVSLNHAFGPKFEADVPETPAQKAARFYAVKRDQVRIRSLGVDVLEVGYRKRGGMTLPEHLELWDALSANAIFLTGSGVTDSHGRGIHNLIGWGRAEEGLATVNNFVTWLHTEEASEGGFVRAMKSGRAYFGDPYRWKGNVDLRTSDGFRMGQVVITDRTAHDLIVQVSNVSEDVQVRLRQFLILDQPPFEYLTPDLLRDEILSDDLGDHEFADTVAVNTTGASFVRVEVHDGLGRELVFSNPLYFFHSVPGGGVGFGRVAGRWEDLRLFWAEGVTLRSASYLVSPRVLALGVDEGAKGTGSLAIDCGASGPPSAVSGASSVVFSSGILTLSGFSGLGSTIQLGWGATGSDLRHSVSETVQLDAARPNPFRHAAVARFHLPSEAASRIEILDVGGRRVRLLLDAQLPAGAHAVDWDGRDDGGRRVANGIYLLRLEADGSRLVRKVVKME